MWFFTHHLTDFHILWDKGKQTECTVIIFFIKSYHTKFWFMHSNIKIFETASVWQKWVDTLLVSKHIQSNFNYCCLHLLIQSYYLIQSRGLERKSPTLYVEFCKCFFLCSKFTYFWKKQILLNVKLIIFLIFHHLMEVNDM